MSTQFTQAADAPSSEGASSEAIRLAQEFKDESDSQRQFAWERSAEVRRKRAMLRDAMKAKEIDAYKVLRGEMPEAIELVVANMKLRQILPYVPRVGKARVVDIISAFDSSADTKMGRLTPERRRDLAMITKGACEA